MYYPVMLNIENKPCVIFGGGSVAARKARELLNCEARLTIVSPALSEALKQLYQEGRFSWVEDVYKESDLKGAWLCFACTDHEETNRLIAETAERQGIFFNAADHNPMDGSFQSSFIVPAVRRVEDVTLAVSCKDNPAASRYMAGFLYDSIQAWMVNYIRKVRQLRIRCRMMVKDSKSRQDFMKGLFSKAYLELAQNNIDVAISEAEHELDKLVKPER
jgi:precorrin-2 dehydrogenase/sirohydrochlorin ferrochelatase